MRRLRRERQPQPLREYLEANAFVGGAAQLVVALLIASLATGRSNGHVLTPAVLAGLVAGSAATGVLIGWPLALYGGAADLLAGLVLLDDTASRWSSAAGADDLDGRRLWTTLLRWSAGAGAWALAGGGLVAAVLDGRRANTFLVAVCLFGIGGIGGRAVDLVARRRGVDAARLRAVDPSSAVPLRRRAWRQVALPMAAGQLIVHVAVGWLLFHDYAVGDPYAPRALTESVALADVGTIVVVTTVLIAWVTAQWGAVDAALGKVAVAAADAPAGGRPLGVQGLVYVAFAAIVVGHLAGLFMPATPSLVRVMVIRGLFAGLVTVVVAAAGYVRGALNRTAVQALVAVAA